MKSWITFSCCSLKDIWSERGAGMITGSSYTDLPSAAPCTGTVTATTGEEVMPGLRDKAVADASERRGEVERLGAFGDVPGGTGELGIDG